MMIGWRVGCHEYRFVHHQKIVISRWKHYLQKGPNRWTPTKQDRERVIQGVCRQLSTANSQLSRLENTTLVWECMIHFWPKVGRLASSVLHLQRLRSQCCSSERLKLFQSLAAEKACVFEWKMWLIQRATRPDLFQAMVFLSGILLWKAEHT